MDFQVRRLQAGEKANFNKLNRERPDVASSAMDAARDAPINRGKHVFIAQEAPNGPVLGVGMLTLGGVDGHEAGLHHQYVLKDERHQGIGKALILARVEHALQLKAREIFVSLDNPKKGTKFYEKLGFRKVKGYDEVTRPKLVLKLGKQG